MKSVNKFFEKGIQYLQGKILVVYGAFYAVCSTPVEAESRPAKKLGFEQVVKKVRASREKKEMFKPVFDSAIAV